MGREMEYIALTQDTTESDLKQRREIITGGSAKFFDQAPVQAAIHGRVLIVEGLEKVERNVMPVLNNLLENREMSLEDGRFLMEAKRYDSLSPDELERARAVRVHPRFRVLALGVPVPPFPGNPLDPPLRSRFQARRIDRCPTQALVAAMRVSDKDEGGALPGLDFSDDSAGTLAEVPVRSIRQLLDFSEALHAIGDAQAEGSGLAAQGIAFHQLMYCGEVDVLSAARLLQLFPDETLPMVMPRIYPQECLYNLTSNDSLSLVNGILESSMPVVEGDRFYWCSNVERAPAGSRAADRDGTDVILTFLGLPSAQPFNGPDSAKHASTHLVRCRGGEAPLGFPPIMAMGPSTQTTTEADGSVLDASHYKLLSSMLQSHSTGKDLCLMGRKGSGKSFMARLFARVLGYAPLETLFVYQDMTARDLLQRRSTDEYGATTWMPTPLSIAIQTGRLAVLDGLQRLPLGTIAVLLRLLQDREITLFDGTRFMRHDRYDRLVRDMGLDEAQMEARRVFRVHPSFRVLALATPPQRAEPWLTNEVLHLFHFFRISMEMATIEGQGHAEQLINTIVPESDPSTSAALAAFGARMEGMESDRSSTVVSAVSLRQMLRLARRSAAHPQELHTSLSNACMLVYMPKAERDAVAAVLQECGVAPTDTETALTLDTPDIIVDDEAGTLSIGAITTPLSSPNNPALVPDVLFYNIPSHVRLLRSMLQDLLMGENLLLIGNQGVGKNKLTDKLLQLMRREREYIQLHRDTTVPSLTLTPTLIDGRIVWEDSPLVKAMTNGRILMVDEADKAPTEVVCVLKGLLEDGEILLGDGRRFITSRSSMWVLGADILPANVNRVHEGFKVIALANRPGYPFLGNDFFAEMGDIFAVFAIDNPDQQSEIEMLQAYSNGALPVATLFKLTSAFKDLRKMTEDGLLSYPYSTRELVNIVRHMSRFPDESVTQVLENVFAFDSFDSELRKALYDTFQKHGIPLGTHADSMRAVETNVAPARPLGEAIHVASLLAPQETWLIAGGAPELKVTIDAPVPLEVSDVRGLGKGPGYEGFQARTIAQLSGRVGRFSEEVSGFTIAPSTTGAMGCARDGLVGLSDNRLAVLAEKNAELQLIDVSDDTVQVIPLGALENNLTSSPPIACYTPPPQMVAAMHASKVAAAKKAGGATTTAAPAGGGDQLLIFSARHSALLVCDAADGSVLPLDVPLAEGFGNNYTYETLDVGMCDALLHTSGRAGAAGGVSTSEDANIGVGALVIYQRGGRALHLLDAIPNKDGDGVTRQLWRDTVVHLGEGEAVPPVEQVEAMSARQLLIRCADGSSFELLLHFAAVETQVVKVGTSRPVRAGTGKMLGRPVMPPTSATLSPVRIAPTALSAMADGAVEDTGSKKAEGGSPIDTALLVLAAASAKTASAKQPKREAQAEARAAAQASHTLAATGMIGTGPAMKFPASISRANGAGGERVTMDRKGLVHQLAAGAHSVGGYTMGHKFDPAPRRVPQNSGNKDAKQQPMKEEVLMQLWRYPRPNFAAHDPSGNGAVSVQAKGVAADWCHLFLSDAQMMVSATSPCVIGRTVLEVVDLAKQTVSEVLLASEVGGDPNAALEQLTAQLGSEVSAGAADAVAVPMADPVVGMCELADGRLVVALRSGAVKLLEVRDEQLAAAADEWSSMIVGR
jgi:MoxR-like ATPase